MNKKYLNICILSALSVLPIQSIAAEAVKDTEKKIEKPEHKTLQEQRSADAEMEVIEITGFAGSIQRSMNAKRYANQVVDGVSAEDIGDLPDDNIAEALSRIAGVSMSRDQGEGSQVSIRGMDPSFVKVTLNGQDMASSTIDSDRSFNLNNISSQMVKAIEVFKSPVASQTEGSMGAQINLKTRSPLEIKDSSGNIVAKTEKNTVSDIYAKNISAFYGMSFLDQTFAISGSINYYDRASGNESFETGGWNRMQAGEDKSNGRLEDGSWPRTVPNVFVNPAFDPAVDTIPANGVTNLDAYLMKGARSHFKIDARERTGGNLAAAWQVNDELSFEWNNAYSKQERTMDAHFEGIYSTNRLPDHHNADVLQIVDQNVVTWGNAPGRWTKENIGFSGNLDDYSNETFLSSLKGEWLGEEWTFSGSIAYSEAEGTKHLKRSVFRADVVGLGYELVGDGNTANAIYPKTYDRDDLSQFKLTNYSDRYFIGSEQKHVAQFDSSYTFSDSVWLDSVEFGVRYGMTDKDNQQIDGQHPTKYMVPDFEEKNGELLGEFDENGDPIRVPVTLDQYDLASSFYGGDDFISNAPNDTWYKVDNVQLANVFGEVIEHEEVPDKNWHIRETTLGGYVQANIDIDLDGFYIRGNLGVRAVNTKDDIDGVRAERVGRRDPYIITDNSSKLDYNDVLPSMNIAFVITEDFIIRTAAGKVMSRPKYNQIAPVYRIDYDNNVLRKGNPELEPYRATEYNFGAEWYFNKSSLLALGWFYKDIESYITGDSYKEYRPEITPIDDPVERLDPLNWTTIITNKNSESASVSGYEFTYTQRFTELPAPFDGLGTSINYTYNDSKSEEIDLETGETYGLKGLSKNTVNAAVYWQKHGITARLAYQYRSEYFRQILGGGLNQARYIDDYQQLDASFKYQVTKSLNVSLSATNLTDEKQVNYVGDESRVYNVSYAGRQYAVGFRYKF